MDYTQQLDDIIIQLETLLEFNYQIREVLIALFIGIAVISVTVILYKFLKTFI